MPHLTKALLTSLALPLLSGPLAAQTVLSGDHSVFGSLCAGDSCGGSESFGGVDIKIKELNPQLLFEDASNSSGFPTRDWRILTNAYAQENFIIEDMDAGRDVFVIEGNAPSASLYMSNTGSMGLGTTLPMQNLHITGIIPGIRLEQTSSGSEYQWDILADHTAIAIVDMPAGTTPLLIEAGAPPLSFYIEETGNVGFGTNATDGPTAPLHVLKSGATFTADSETTVLTQNNANPTDRNRFTLISGNQGVGQFAFGDTDDEFAGRIRYFHSNDEMDFIVGKTLEVLSMHSTGPNALSTATSSAVLTSAGVWQNASSRTLKQNINTLSLEDAKTTLKGLEPVSFNYIKEPDELTLGFIAEDVPDMVATASHDTLSGLDIIAVLTRVVQEQDEVIAALQEQAEIRDARLDQLEMLLAE